jgi:hypothetical protein
MNNRNNSDNIDNAKLVEPLRAGAVRRLFVGFWLGLIGAVVALPHVYNGEYIRLAQGGLMVLAVLASWLWHSLRREMAKPE